MTYKRDIPNALKYAAYALIGTSLFGVLLASNVQSRGDFGGSFLIFIAIATFVNVLVGLGILSRSRWGFMLLKAFLYFYLIGFPIGTYISYKSLKYLKDNEISKLYH